LLRVRAHVPEDDGDDGLTGLRVLLVTDLLFRIAEMSGLQVFTVRSFASRSPAQVADLDRAAKALVVHPAEEALAGPVDVHVAIPGVLKDDQNGVVLPVAAAHLRGESGLDELLAGRGRDPLAVRLALMSCTHFQPADLTDGDLASAQETLGQWRLRVAGWAEFPSRPMPPQIAAAIKQAFGDMGIVAALSALRALEIDDGVPGGAKFETFVYADRVLGLDLSRDIGRLSG
jgi:hypothetical protein